MDVAEALRLGNKKTFHINTAFGYLKEYSELNLNQDKATSRRQYR